MKINRIFQKKIKLTTITFKNNKLQFLSKLCNLKQTLKIKNTFHFKSLYLDSLSKYIVKKKRFGDYYYKINFIKLFWAKLIKSGQSFNILKVLFYLHKDLKQDFIQNFYIFLFLLDFSILLKPNRYRIGRNKLKITYSLEPLQHKYCFRHWLFSFYCFQKGINLGTTSGDLNKTILKEFFFISNFKSSPTIKVMSDLYKLAYMFKVFIPKKLRKHKKLKIVIKKKKKVYDLLLLRKKTVFDIFVLQLFLNWKKYYLIVNNIVKKQKILSLRKRFLFKALLYRLIIKLNKIKNYWGALSKIKKQYNKNLDIISFKNLDKKNIKYFKRYF